MKSIIKSLAIVFSIVAMFVATTLQSDATGYKKSATPVATPAGWNIQRFQHTFIATTDTAYFPIQMSTRTTNFADTLMRVFNIKIEPLSDTSNVQWEIWTASDISGWSNGVTATTIQTTLWKQYTVGRDSNASGRIYRVIPVGSGVYGAWQPYIMLVGIGKAALSNGKGNEVGNVIKVDAYKP